MPVSRVPCTLCDVHEVLSYEVVQEAAFALALSGSAANKRLCGRRRPRWLLPGTPPALKTLPLPAELCRNSANQPSQLLRWLQEYCFVLGSSADFAGAVCVLPLRACRVPAGDPCRLAACAPEHAGRHACMCLMGAVACRATAQAWARGDRLQPCSRSTFARARDARRAGCGCRRAPCHLSALHQNNYGIFRICRRMSAMKCPQSVHATINAQSAGLKFAFHRALHLHSDRLP